MRILVLDTIYEEALLSFRESFNSHFLKTKAVDRQFSSYIKSKRFGTSTTYEYYFKKSGVECLELILNSIETWKEVGLFQTLYSKALSGKESWLSHKSLNLGIPISKYLPTFKMIIKEIKLFKPQVVILKDLHFYPRDFRDTLRESGIKIVGFVSNNIQHAEVLNSCDLVVSSVPKILDLASQANIPSHYMLPAFDLRNIEFASNKREFNTVFAGSIYGNTVDFLRGIKEVDKSLRIYSPISFIPILKKHNLLEQYFGEAWGSEVYEIYGKSKIVVNRHGEVARNLSANMRLFEGTGMGACVITEASSNLKDLFTPFEEVIPYQSHNDAAKQVENSLSNRTWSEIGNRAQLRVFQDHTTGKRYSILLEVIANLLEK
jgi:hypothetical protein